jgi:hypothetical protein
VELWGGVRNLRKDFIARRGPDPTLLFNSETVLFERIVYIAAKKLISFKIYLEAPKLPAILCVVS